MKNTIRFWTSEEIEAGRAAISKFRSITEAATYLAPKLNRTISATIFKLSWIKKGGVSKEYKKSKSINLPKGFSFEFTLKKAEMTKDYIKIYF